MNRKFIIYGLVIAMSMLMVGCDSQFMKQPKSLIHPPSQYNTVSTRELTVEEYLKSIMEFGEDLYSRTATLNEKPSGERIYEGINRIDLDNDGKEETVALYTNSQKNLVGAYVISKEDDQWVLIGKIEDVGVNIIDFKVVDFDEDSVKGILLVSMIPESYLYSITINKLSEERLVNLLNETMSIYTYDDLDNDNTQELVLVRSIKGFSDSIEYSTVAEVYHYKNDRLEMTSSAILDEFGYYAQEGITTGYIRPDLKGVFIEVGQGAHSATTNVLYLKNGKLTSVFGSNIDKQYELTFKSHPSMSRDIDGDGIYEISIPTEIYGDEASYANATWLYKWYVWNGKDGLEYIITSYGDREYDLLLPERWGSSMSFEEYKSRVTENNWTEVAYKLTDDENVKSIPIYRIEQVLVAEYNSANYDEKTYLITDGSTIYTLANIYDDHGLSNKERKEINKMLLTKDEIIANFKFRFEE